MSAASLVGKRKACAILPIKDPWQNLMVAHMQNLMVAHRKDLMVAHMHNLMVLTARALPRLPHVAMEDPGLLIYLKFMVTYSNMCHFMLNMKCVSFHV